MAGMFQKNDVVDVLTAPGQVAQRAVVTDVYSDTYYGLRLEATGMVTASGPEFMTLVSRPEPQVQEQPSEPADSGDDEDVIRCWSDLSPEQLRELFDIGEQWERDHEDVQNTAEDLLDYDDYDFDDLKSAVEDAFTAEENVADDDDDDEDDPEDRDIVTMDDIPEGGVDELCRWAEEHQITHDYAYSLLENLVDNEDWCWGALKEAFKDEIVGGQQVPPPTAAAHIRTVDDITDGEWSSLGASWHRLWAGRASIGAMRGEVARVISTLPENMKPMTFAYLKGYCETLWQTAINVNVPAPGTAEQQQAAPSQESLRGEQYMTAGQRMACGGLPVSTSAFDIPVVHSQTLRLGLLQEFDVHEDIVMAKVKTLDHAEEWWHIGSVLALDKVLALLRRS